MPKDKTKNVDRYKIRGGVINEYEYHQNQGALAQNEPRGDGRLMPGTPPGEGAEGLQPTVAPEARKSGPQKGTKGTKTKKAAAKAATSTKSSKLTKASKSTNTAKPTKKVAKKSMQGASAKKLAARKAAKK